MDFVFQPPNSETVYDNHGCPCLTKCEMNFTVDGVDFRAVYADTYRNIELYSEGKLITSKIYRNSGVGDLKSIHEVIQKAFEQYESLKKEFHRRKGGTLEGLKENLCKDLLAEFD